MMRSLYLPSIRQFHPWNEVLHGHGHLAVGPADELLELLREQRIGFFGFGFELQAFVVTEHPAPFPGRAALVARRSDGDGYPWGGQVNVTGLG